jgi:hypothetical protein
MNSNYDHFSKWNAKFAHFRKFIVIEQKLIQKMWCIGENMNIFNKNLQ